MNILNTNERPTATNQAMNLMLSYYRYQFAHDQQILQMWNWCATIFKRQKDKNYNKETAPLNAPKHNS